MKKVDLNYGSGGRQMQEFIKKSIVSKLANGILERLDDAAVLDNPKTSRMAMTSDSFVVSPLFFEGGDIGKICIAGTANDLATSGAQVHAMSLSFIIEEGMDLEELDRIVDSIASSAKEANIKIVTGDTKVVEQGKGDGLFINTAAVGFIPEGINFSSYNARFGDVVMVTGPIGNHEVAMKKARKMIPFDVEIKSDVAPLNLKVKKLVESPLAQEFKVVKDPTRGGLASALHEIAEHSQVDILINEENLPVDQEVKAVCELAGLDPLYLANEGKYVIVGTEKIVSLVKEVFGPSASMIGKIQARKGANPSVAIETRFGALRRVGPLETVQLPRIC